jgi:protein-S-isoprenylcysteine O-methyltransferase Ste14
MEKTIRRVAAAIVVAALTLAGSLLTRDVQQSLGAVAGVLALALLILSRIHLGRSFSMHPEAKALVTRGLYSKLEHPLYCFLDLFLAALILVLGMPVLLGVWGLLVLVHLFECRREERVLAAAFGEEYAAYTRRTWL